MIKCICINAKGKPTIIPEEKWVKENNTYHIIHIGTTIGGRIMCCTLSEINLGKQYYPYEGFRLERFAFNEKDLPALFELMKKCAELNNVDINELINQPIKTTEEQLCTN